LFSDHWATTEPPTDFAGLLAAEEEAARRDPYRGLAALTHTIAMTCETPGADLGPSPESRSNTEARLIKIENALAGIDREPTTLREGLSELPPDAWATTVTLDDSEVDPYWIVRHAVHNGTHHLLDVKRVRDAL
jgi:hypothetical protein